MDKKHKEQRRKVPSAEELADVSPRGASFDTEAGRAAQGMRPDLGGDAESKTKPEDATPDAKPEDVKPQDTKHEE